MSNSKPTYQELEKRLAAAESIVNVLKGHEVDAVVGEETIAVLLLREVEEALRISDAGFRAMFDLSGVGMVQADTPGFRFTRVNQKFCEMAGYSAEELLAKTYIGLTHPLDRPRDMRELARVLQGKANSWSIVKRCVRQDGTAIWVGVHGAVLRDDAGRAVRIMAMISDLTASKQAEQDMRNAQPLAEKDKSMQHKRAAVEAAAVKTGAVRIGAVKKTAVEKGPPIPQKRRAGAGRKPSDKPRRGGN